MEVLTLSLVSGILFLLEASENLGLKQGSIYQLEDE